MTAMLTARKKHARTLLRALKKLFPDAGMVLRYSNNWELTVAVILSAQCTDKRVNEVTSRLFKKYATYNDYAEADQKEFEQDIFATGFYHAKAKNIIAAARMLRDDYGGTLPKTIEEMTRLPGVGRKTANVVLGNAYGIVEGIAVDTHVTRLARRFQLTQAKTPEKIERDLMELFPRTDWFLSTYLFIEYGRTYCPARGCPSDHPLHSFETLPAVMH